MENEYNLCIEKNEDDCFKFIFDNLKIFENSFDYLIKERFFE